jgi:hypothetical protein
MRMATCVLAAALACGGAVAADVAPDALARQAIAAVKREPDWQEIKVDRAKPTDYSLTLVHKRSQAAETQRTTCPPSSSPSSNGTRRPSSARS